MKVVTAPLPYKCKNTDIKCFLAGGITNCPNWQKDVIDVIKSYDESFGHLDDLVIFNPRRNFFPIDNPDAAKEQIEWEFKWLQCMDLFTIWFAKGESDQPICLYELGRNLQRMMDRFPKDYAERILISCSQNYKRATDVKIQTALAFSSNGNWEPTILDKDDPVIYAHQIIRQYKIIKMQEIA